MVRTLVILPDGREIFSGAEGTAVMAAELTQCVNSETELTPGAACAQMAQLQLLDAGDLHIAAGDALTLYRVDEAGIRHKAGTFFAEKPSRQGQLLSVTAYDKMILSDVDLTLWLQALTAWPYRLQHLAELVCARCGLELAPGDIPNGDFPVAAFRAEGVTGRQLLKWIAQAAGCFCRLDEAQRVAFSWYTPAPVAAAPRQLQVAVTCREESVAFSLDDQPPFTLEGDFITAAYGDGRLQLSVEEGLLRQFYYGGSTFSDYCTAPIERVQLRQSTEDVGTMYPPDAEGNTLAITGNPLLTAANAQTLQPVAQSLYDRLRGSSYTPCTLRLPDTPGIAAGQLLTVHRREGAPATVYIMELRRGADGMTLRCTGSQNRQSASAVNTQTQQLQGKILRLRTDVDGILAENSDDRGRISRLEMDVDGLRGQVSSQNAQSEGLEQQLTRLEQTAGALQLSVETLRQTGAAKLRTAMGYTFDDSGLQIAREGAQMQNRLDNTGMYVLRAGETILEANHKGVTATDVTVRNYLVVGSHARLEDFGAGRTACYWLEG